ncbi:MAG: hypothetical protein IJW50_01930 [Clostridia bacterium]|nr:hypothetical protein [Clostridia bacterium]
MDQEKTSVGYLIVHVTTARGAIPLEGAQVNIRGYESEFNDGRGDILTSTATDRDGNTERIVLTAPLKSNSLSPNVPSPFATYFLEVRLEGYGMQSFIAVPIFEGITAIQPVDMIPLSENGTNAPLRPSEERFFETVPPSL